MSRTPRRPLRTGVTLAGLLLSAGSAFPLTAAPALAGTGDTPRPAQAQTSGDCDSLETTYSDSGSSTSSFGSPGEPIAGSADADAQTASIYGIADLRGSARSSDSCRVSAGFDNVLHVGPGTSGLAEGAPVTLVATVEFDPVLDEVNTFDEEQITSWEVVGGYTVVDPHAPCIPDEESGDGCAPAGPVARFVASTQRTVFAELGSTANSYSDPDGRFHFVRDHDWELTSNTGQDEGDSGSVNPTLCEQFPCEGDPVEPSRLDAAQLAPPGPQQLVFTTRVGASLEVGGAVSLLVQAYDGQVAAFVDGRDGLSADVAPAAGFEGLELILGDAPPPPPLDEVAPVVTATLSAPANAAGWHRAPVTVQLGATDAGSGVRSIAYAVGSGVPTTVAGSSVPVTVAQDGTTAITYTATDVAGNASAPQTTTVRLDRGAPVLQLPSPVTVAATGPSGAVVGYASSASDALSGATSSCAPASGSTFPVGTTTVTCTAVDGAGNSATGTFPVTVTAAPAPQTPAQRLDALQAQVTALQAPAGVRATLDAKLAQTGHFLGKGKGPQACTHLAQFVEHVRKNTGTKGIASADAARLTSAAAALRTALSC